MPLLLGQAPPLLFQLPAFTVDRVGIGLGGLFGFAVTESEIVTVAKIIREILLRHIVRTVIVRVAVSAVKRGAQMLRHGHAETLGKIGLGGGQRQIGGVGFRRGRQQKRGMDQGDLDYREGMHPPVIEPLAAPRRAVC